MRGDEWSAEENAAVVSTYLTMLAQELSHQSYTKSDFRSALMERIPRSKGSIEMKNMNISAVLRDMRCIYIDGYKPARNYQAALADEVRAQLSENRDLGELMLTSVNGPAVARTDVVWFEGEPTLPLADIVGQRPARPFFTDYVLTEAANRALGLAGEKAVVDKERRMLTDHGRPDLAERVEHSSLTRGDGLGYDITSFTPYGRERYIEVKTTRRDVNWPMIVSRNEVDVSLTLGDDFELCRVFHFDRRQVGVYTLTGPIEHTCDLRPESFRALPKLSPIR